MNRQQYVRRFIGAACRYLQNPTERNWKRLVDLAAQMQLAESVS